MTRQPGRGDKPADRPLDAKHARAIRDELAPTVFFLWKMCRWLEQNGYGLESRLKVLTDNAHAAVRDLGLRLDEDWRRPKPTEPEQDWQI